MSWSQIITLLLLLMLVIVSAKKKDDDYEYSDEKDNNKNVKKGVTVESSDRKVASKKANKPKDDDDDYSDEKDTKTKNSGSAKATKKKGSDSESEQEATSNKKVASRKANKPKDDDDDYSDEKDTKTKNSGSAKATKKKGSDSESEQEATSNKKVASRKASKPKDDDDYSDEKDTKTKDSGSAKGTKKKGSDSESEQEATENKKQDVSAEDDVDYCDLYDCGYRHIGCNNDGKFDPKCSRSAKVDRLDNLKKKIVDLHNKQRNKIAAGVGGLPAAGRMASMQWHKELAKMAYFTVLKCTLDTDLCRNTKDFKHSGYNGLILGYSGDETTEISYKTVVKTAIKSWFNESEHVTPDIIKCYKGHADEGGNTIGHFTLVANDRNTHVGCAIVRYPEAGFQRVLFICNYATQNFKEEPVYTAALVPASKCTTGHHHKYKNLCSADEVYEDEY